ncbi:MAG TPA: prepilin-type N-terminal cleavage/methylation domain-containing protein [Halanaerobiales bacterium]|nr:prepilin-type N-terminal cleavage/methylation domain-containing protein [Halanaerobiales bacterium]
MNNLQKERGFTLIELIVVIAVIGILASIAVPRYTNVKDKADLTVIKMDLKNIQTLVEIYALENENQYPSQTEFENLDFVKQNYIYLTNVDEYLVYYEKTINNNFYYIKNGDNNIKNSETIPEI